MNTKNNMLIIKGEIKTSEVISCQYNQDTHKWYVKFKNGKLYAYTYSNVEWLKNPESLNLNLYRLSRERRPFFNMTAIYVFKGECEYWHICFGDGSERDYRRDDLTIEKSVLSQKQAMSVLAYIKQIAQVSNLRNEETGENLLTKQYEKVNFVGENIVLAKYLNPALLQKGKDKKECGFVPIFPFGCNNSQYKAVKNAMESQISIIQGPPGTGKTQTILNIIANILMQDKTVQIVSNNNAATENVYEKLSSPRYNLGFIAATLGKSDNRKSFVANQNINYPDFTAWKTEDDLTKLQQQIAEQSTQLKFVFDKKEKLACLKQELSGLITELEYFRQYIEESDVDTELIKLSRKLSSEDWMTLWQESQLISEKEKTMGFIFKIKALIRYGIISWNFYKQDIAKIIITFQAMYYCAKQAELSDEIAEIESYLDNVDQKLLDNLCDGSMKLLKNKLAGRYGENDHRRIFSEDDLKKEPYSFCKSIQLY